MRQLPQVWTLNHFSFFRGRPSSIPVWTATQPAPWRLPPVFPARMSSHGRTPFGMLSPGQTPGCSGSGCLSGGSSPA